MKFLYNLSIFIDIYILNNANAYKQAMLNGGFIGAKDISKKELYIFFKKKY
jgi:hypothetical protein